METLLTELVGNSNTPLLTALLLGLLTAISPCPMATNITAIGFIGKNIDNKRHVFVSGLIYTLGRVCAYTLLATIIFFGADQFKLSTFFQTYGERFIGPLLLIVGVLMLDVVKINGLSFNGFTERMSSKGRTSHWQVFLLGMIYAMAFCPYSGVLYFGMLIPLTLSSSSGLMLPAVFAIATGIPVIVFAWLISYTVSGVGKLYNGLKHFEKWFRKIVAILFIAVGIYYIFLMFF